MYECFATVMSAHHIHILDLLESEDDSDPLKFELKMKVNHGVGVGN